MIIVAAVCLLLILLVSFTLAYAGRDVTMLTDRSLNLNVNGQSVIIPLDQDQAVYDLPCLTTERDNVFILENDAGASIKVEGVTLKTGRSAKIGLSKIADNYKLTVTVETSKDNRTIYFRTKSSLLPEMQITGQNAAGGEYLVTQADKPVMYKLDANGNITWYVALSDSEARGQTFANLQKHVLENGDVRYSYQLVDPDIETYGISDYFPGKTVVMNEKFEIMANDAGGYTRLAQNADNDSKVPGDPVDGHGFIVLADDDRISESYAMQKVTNIPAALSPASGGTRVLAAIVQEVKGTTEVAFQWNSTDHPELYALSTTGNQYSGDGINDYLHLNAMLLDPTDNNIILSFKNADCLVKINRTDGSIMWILGGSGDQFGLTSEQKFTAQTDVTLNSDGSLTILDGDRIETLTLDQSAKKVTAYTSVPLTGQKVSTYGSAQKTGDNLYAIAYGKDSGKVALAELNTSTGLSDFEVLYPSGGSVFRANWYTVTEDKGLFSK
jgi:arylsulfate sulfotransferase